MTLPTTEIIAAARETCWPLHRMARRTPAFAMLQSPSEKKKHQRSVLETAITGFILRSSNEKLRKNWTASH